METFAGLCRNMADDPNIMTFRDISISAANGAALGIKHSKSVEGAVIGAVVGISVEAGTRVVHISKELLGVQELSDGAWHESEGRAKVKRKMR